MDTVERQVLFDLISGVRTLANQILAVHLQLGALRTLLARQGTITTAELDAIMTELGALTAFDELSAEGAPGPDEVFDDLLRRLDRAA
jgi:hypothetical protein